MNPDEDKRKTRWRITDPLVAKVHKIMKSMQPRPEVTEQRKTDWGFLRDVCPVCGELTAQYNAHFANAHGEQYWKEKEIIRVVKESLSDHR